MIEAIEDLISQLIELSREHDLPVMVLYAPEPGKVGMRSYIEPPTARDLAKAAAKRNNALVAELTARIVSCVVIDKCSNRAHEFMAGNLTKEEERDLSELHSLGIEIYGALKVEGSDHVH